MHHPGSKDEAVTHQNSYAPTLFSFSQSSHQKQRAGNGDPPPLECRKEDFSPVEGQ